MDEVSMDDGLDGPELLVFGLGAAETATLVVTLLTAWVCVAGLPAALGWPLGVTLAAGGAALGWGRRDERTLLAWAMLAARFGWRQRERVWARGLERLARALTRVRARASRRLAAAAARRSPTRLSASLGGESGALVLPLVLPRPNRPAPHAGARLVAIVALRGGSGRTVLACALAARLAGRGGVPEPRGWRPLRVVLLDLDERLPGASLHWGAQLGGPPHHHRSGAVLHPSAPDGGIDPAAAVERGSTGADVVIVDAAWREPGAAATLQRCDDIIVVVEPTPVGWLDAYRSVAWLRRIGLRDRLLLVANRCGDGDDLAELEGDLGLDVVARIPVTDDLEGTAGVAALAALLTRRLLGGRAPGVADAEAG